MDESKQPVLTFWKLGKAVSDTVFGNKCLPVNHKACFPHFIDMGESSTINNKYYEKSIKCTTYDTAESQCRIVYGQDLIYTGRHR